MKIDFKKIFIEQGIIFILTLALIVGIAYYPGARKYILPKVNEGVINNTEINTSDWKTYTNEKYGFSFKYPESFGIPDESVGQIEKLDCNSKAYAEVSLDNIGLGLACPRVLNENSYKGNSENVIVAGRNSFSFAYTSATDYNNREVYIPLNDNLYLSIGYSNKSGQLGSVISMKDFEIMLSTFKFISPSIDSSKKTMEVTIQVPEDSKLYDSLQRKHFDEGGINQAKFVKFIPKKVIVPYSDNIIKASTQAAAGNHMTEEIVYFKIVNKKAYILLEMDIDGWAGVSSFQEAVHPYIEKTLLQFPEIESVIFDVAPGDSKHQISESYVNSSTPKLK